jgi:hypothetical protein
MLRDHQKINVPGMDKEKELACRPSHPIWDTENSTRVSDWKVRIASWKTLRSLPARGEGWRPGKRSVKSSLRVGLIGKRIIILAITKHKFTTL